MDSLDRTFGLTIAFLLPGFIVVVGLSPLVPEFARWLSQDGTAPTFGGFSYAVVASLLIGMVVSGTRWLVIDALMHRTGLQRPDFDFSRLQGNLQAFEVAVQHNYRFYQFYANTCVSSCGVAVAHLASGMVWPLVGWAGFVILQAIQLVAARDCLARYYCRLGQILGQVQDDRLFLED